MDIAAFLKDNLIFEKDEGNDIWTAKMTFQDAAGNIIHWGMRGVAHESRKTFKPEAEKAARERIERGLTVSKSS